MHRPCFSLLAHKATAVKQRSTRCYTMTHMSKLECLRLFRNKISFETIPFFCLFKISTAQYSVYADVTVHTIEIIYICMYVYKIFTYLRNANENENKPNISLTYALYIKNI